MIVYDRLVSNEVMELGRREAEYIYVGKTPGEPSIGQGAINDILIEKASEGLAVVRLNLETHLSLDARMKKLTLCRP